MSSSVISQTRYEKAQAFEADYWNSRQRDPVGVIHDLESPFALFQHLQSMGYLQHCFRRLLDLGCGGLGIGVLWLLKADEAYGLDPLQVLPPETGCVLLDDFIKGVQARTQYVMAQAESMPFEGGYFDCVICNNVLDLVHDPGAILAEIKRCLAPGGLFAFAVDTYSLRGLIAKKILKKLRPDYGSLPGHPYEWTERQMSVMLELHGFKIESHRPRSWKGRWLGWVRRSTWLLRHNSN